MTDFTAIHPQDVGFIWPQVSPGLSDMLENYTIGKWTEPEVLEQLQIGEWQLFVIWENGEPLACLICMVVDAHVRTLELGMCWGKGVNDWDDQVDEAINRIAIDLGCDQLALDGRPGWRNIMRKHGFDLKSVTYTRACHG